MNRVDVENQLLQEIHNLSVEKLEEILDFVLFVKHSIINSNNNHSLNQARPLGLLEGKAKCHIHDDFKITDEEFLRS
jgi:hypothetical protein